MLFVMTVPGEVLSDVIRIAQIIFVNRKVNNNLS